MMSWMHAYPHQSTDHVTYATTDEWRHSPSVRIHARCTTDGRYVGGDVTRHAPPPGRAPHASPTHTGVGRRTVGWRGTLPRSWGMKTITRQIARGIASQRERKFRLDQSSGMIWVESNSQKNVKNLVFDFLSWL